MIFYITKEEMIKKWNKNYFGLTVYSENNIYIRDDLPKCVKESVLGHEQWHLKQGKHMGEFGAWIAGFKANWKGFFLSILMSFMPSRLKMYPELVAFSCLIIFFLWAYLRG